MLIEGTNRGINLVNGATGINLTNPRASVVENCIIRTANDYGIIAGQVTDCMAINVLGTPINATTASNCIGKKTDGSNLIVQTNPPTGEARTPINSAPYTISTPGSYYLTGNVNVASGSGITVSASGVTLDLNGFTISSSAGATTDVCAAISISGNSVTVQGGHIAATGFYYAIDAGAAFSDITVRQITVAGDFPQAINLSGPNTSVDACSITGGTAGSITDFAIKAKIVSATRVQTGGYGGVIASVVTGCHVTGGNLGISATVCENSFAIGTYNNSQGLQADVATGCWGQGGALGIDAKTSTNCAALARITAIQGKILTGCYGTSSTSVSVVASGPASFCVGSRSSAGIAVQAGIAIACTVDSPGNTVSSSSKQLGTP